MRSRVKHKLTGKTADGWYPWFAWYPVKVKVPIENPNDEKDRAWITAWLEVVEWKHWSAQADGPFETYKLYRLRS